MKSLKRDVKDYCEATRRGHVIVGPYLLLSQLFIAVITNAAIILIAALSHNI